MCRPLKPPMFYDVVLSNGEEIGSHVSQLACQVVSALGEPTMIDAGVHSFGHIFYTDQGVTYLASKRTFVIATATYSSKQAKLLLSNHLLPYT